MDPHRLRAYILLLIVYAIWGFAAPVIKFTLGGLSPALFLTYRFAISAVLAIAIFAFTGIHIPKDKKTLFMLLTCGFLTSTVSLGFLFFGLKDTTVLDSTLITLTAPLLISAAAVYYLHEHITKREKVGMAIALMGTLFTVVEPLLLNGSTRFSGNILILLYLLSNIIPTIQIKILLRNNVSPETISGFSFIIGAITSLPILLLEQSPDQILFNIQNLAIPYHLGVLYMAVLSGTLAYTLSSRAQKTIEVSEATVFSYLYPLFSAPLAVLWLGEKITPTFIVGGVIIATGVIIAEYKKRKKDLAK